MATPPSQLPLALRYPSDQRFEMFVAADPATTIAPLRALSLQPQRGGCLLAGPAGSGKSHLLIAACAEADGHGHRAAYLPVASAAGRMGAALDALQDFDLVAIDGIEAIAGDRDDEVALFEFHNRMHDAGRALLYASTLVPDGLPLTLPDLRSRLNQCTRILLSPLDDAGRRELLRLRAARRGLQVDEAAIDWLLRRVDRDPARLASLFERLDRAALAAQRRITVPFLREVLADA